MPTSTNTPAPTSTASATPTSTGTPAPSLFGLSSCAGGANDSGDYGYLNGSNFPLTVGGTLTSLSVYVGATPGGASVRVALYTTNGSGNPGTLIAETSPQVVVTGWNTLPINPGVSVSAGDYWIVAQTNNRNTVFRIVSGRGANAFVGWTKRAWGTFPSTVASWKKFSNQSFCMYGAVQ